MVCNVQFVSCLTVCPLIDHREKVEVCFDAQIKTQTKNKSLYAHSLFFPQRHSLWKNKSIIPEAGLGITCVKLFSLHYLLFLYNIEWGGFEIIRISALIICKMWSNYYHKTITVATHFDLVNVKLYTK